MLAYSQRASAYLDDWLFDMDNDNSIGVRHGRNVDGLSVLGIFGELNLPSGYDLAFDFFRTNESEGRHDFEYVSAGVNSNPMALWSFFVEYEFFGKRDVYEQNDYKLSIQYFPSNYSIALGASYLDAAAYLDTTLIELVEEDLRGQPALLKKISRIDLSTDGKGYFLDMNYFPGNWQWGLRGKYVEYSPDVALLGARRRLQLVIDQQALSHIFGLIDWRLSADGSYIWDRFSINLGVSRIQSAIDEKKRDYVFSNSEYFPSEWLSLRLTVSDSLDESLPYAEIATRFYW